MRDVRSVAGSTSCLMLLLAGAGTGCDEQTSSASQGESGAVMSLAGALQAAVSECADAAGQCEAAGADAGEARAMCRAQFEACRDAAKAAARPEIDRAVNPCVDAFKDCREAAGAEKEQCRISLGTCLSAQNGDAGGAQAKPENDAEAPKEPQSPVTDCVADLHTCIAGDAPARDCTDALRACIADSVGHKGNAEPGRPGDAGKPDHAQGDAGKPVDPDQGDADVPAEPGNADASKTCKDAREACLSGGDARDACARMLKECRM